MPLTAMEPRALRAVLGRFATGVAVVTALGRDGAPVGMTVNSFTSVSLDPPLVLYCANRASRLFPAFTEAPAFAVNILAESQDEVSRRFARQGLDRFGELRHEAGATGAPLLPGSLAVLECATESVVPAGDHALVLGRVTAAAAVPGAGAPLLFYDGAYRRLDDRHADWWTAFS
jgi:flavin reductase (DIM6/NTAB) family NADH-FMN oxidoreductase RutF